MTVGPTVGIEAIDLYAGRLVLPLADLADARGMDRAYLADRIMAEARSILPPYEDTVTLAVNAARRALGGQDLSSIGLLVVATESAVDLGKPISTWVHRYCGLPAGCRNFEVKHACYGGTAALQVAANWLLASAKPGQRALVVAADHSRAHLGEAIEFICGGAAVAMVLGRDPRLASFDPGFSGCWSSEIADTFRPTLTAEVGDNEASLFSYLDALEGAFAAFEGGNGPVDLRERYAAQIYHTPFPGMAFQAHRTLLRRDELGKAGVKADYDARVAPGLWIARQIGGAYAASILVNVLATLAARPELAAGDRLGVFSYGSGCQAEFFELGVGPAAVATTAALDLAGRLGDRRPVTVATYEAFETSREAQSGSRDFDPMAADMASTYEAAYDGRDLLVLDHVEAYRRHYRWS